MKKFSVYLFVAMLLIITGCSQVTSSGNIYNSTLPKSISDKGSPLSKLKSLYNDVNNAGLPREERVNKQNQLTAGLKDLLAADTQAALSDEELEDSFNGRVMAKTKVFQIDENQLKIRVVRFAGPVVLNGSEHRQWIYVQWWDDNGVYAQLVAEKSPEEVADFFAEKSNNKINLVFTGYLPLYNPNPVFASLWVLDCGHWEKSNNIGDFMVASYFWNLSKDGNRLIIESDSRERVIINVNLSDTSFKVYSEKDESKLLNFRLDEGSLVDDNMTRAVSVIASMYPEDKANLYAEELDYNIYLITIARDTGTMLKKRVNAFLVIHGQLEATLISYHDNVEDKNFWQVVDSYRR